MPRRHLLSILHFAAATAQAQTDQSHFVDGGIDDQIVAKK